MTLKDYLKACVFDFVLCVVLGVCLGYVNAGAFRVAAELQGNVAGLVATSVVLQAALFACAYSRKTLIPGIVGMVVLLVAGTVLFHVVWPGPAGFFDDAEGNGTLLFFVLYFANLLTFVLTRRRVLTRVFYVACALDVGFIQFMYKQNYVVVVCAVLAALVAMAVYRNYHGNVQTTSTTQISFSGAFGVGVGFAVAVLAVAAVVFFGVIAPMNPTAAEFKPFTRYLNYEPVEMTGVAGTSKVDDPNKKNDEVNEQQQDTQDDNLNEDLDTGDEDSSLLESVTKTIYSVVENAQELLQDTYNFMVDNPWSVPLFVLLLAALLSSPYWVKRLLRRRRLERMLALPGPEQVRVFFAFFMKRLGILKVKKLDAQTLAEFKEGVRGKMQPYANVPKNEQGASFDELIDTYSAVVYGHAEPSEGQLSRFRSFYDGFFQAFRQEGGKVKYVLFLRFFRI